MFSRPPLPWILQPRSQPSEGYQGQFVPLLSELRLQVKGTTVPCCLAGVPAKKSVTMLILDLGGRAGTNLRLQLSPVGNNGPQPSLLTSPDDLLLLL